MLPQTDYVLDPNCMHTGNIIPHFQHTTGSHRAEMILASKYVKGYQIDEDRACKLGEVEPTPVERLKSVVAASRMIDRDDYMVAAVGYRVDDPEKTHKFIFVLDLGDEYDELVKRELDVVGKDSLLRAAEFILSGPFVYVYVN